MRVGRNFYCHQFPLLFSWVRIVQEKKDKPIPSLSPATENYSFCYYSKTPEESRGLEAPVGLGWSSLSGADPGQNIKDSALAFHRWKQISAPSWSGSESRHLSSGTGGKVPRILTQAGTATPAPRRPALVSPDITLGVVLTLWEPQFPCL